MFYLILTMILPMLISWLLVATQSKLVLVIFVLTHFVILKCVKRFHPNANIWMFIMVALSTIPLNSCIVKAYIINETISGVFLKILCYGMLLNMEELFMGLFTRWLFKKQKDFVL